jgi:hypothetical protein
MKSKSTKTKVGKLFGVSIQYTDDELPPFVIDTLKYLEENALDREGIFRLSGDNNILQEMKGKLDRGKKVDLSTIKDIHVVSGLLKLYFRSLPEPLCTFECYDMFLAATTVPEADQRMVMIKKVVGFLPSKNYRLLKLLCKFLTKVTANSEVNKMSPEALAICFAPNLIRSDSNDLQLMLKNQKIGTDAMVSLIDHYEYFFGEDPTWEEVKVKKYGQNDLQKLDPEVDKMKQVIDTKQKRNMMMQKSYEVLKNGDLETLYQGEIKKHDIDHDYIKNESIPTKVEIRPLPPPKKEDPNKVAPESPIRFKSPLEKPKEMSPSSDPLDTKKKSVDSPLRFKSVFENPKDSSPSPKTTTGSVFQKSSPIVSPKNPPLPNRTNTVIGPPPTVPPKKFDLSTIDEKKPEVVPRPQIVHPVVPTVTQPPKPNVRSNTVKPLPVPGTSEGDNSPDIPVRRGTVLPPLPTKKL